MQEPARILIIGAGSRGYAYAKAIAKHSNGHGAIVGVAEPLPYKRREFQRRFGIADSLAFPSWSDFVAAGEAIRAKVDGVCVCTLDETHAEVLYPFVIALGGRRGTGQGTAGSITVADRPCATPSESSHPVREAAGCHPGRLSGYAGFDHGRAVGVVRDRPCAAVLAT